MVTRILLFYIGYFYQGPSVERQSFQRDEVGARATNQTDALHCSSQLCHSSVTNAEACSSLFPLIYCGYPSILDATSLWALHHLKLSSAEQARIRQTFFPLSPSKMRLFSLAISAISLVAAMSVPSVLAADAPKGPKITNIVYFDIKVRAVVDPLLRGLASSADSACCSSCLISTRLLIHTRSLDHATRHQ